MKIDPYYQRQKCRPMNLVSGNIRFMGIFAGVPLSGGVKWRWSCRRRQFLAICVATSSETSDSLPHSLNPHIITWWLCGDWVIMLDLKNYPYANPTLSSHGDYSRGFPWAGRQMIVGLSTMAIFGDLCGTSSETSEIWPAISHGDMLPLILSACNWLQNEWPRMTLSANFTSKSVFDQQGCRALTFALARLSCLVLLCYHLFGE